MSKMQRTDVEKWEDIGREAKKLKEQLFKLMNELSGDVPKSVWRSKSHTIDRKITELRSDLEDRLFKEHHPACGFDSDVSSDEMMDFFFGDLEGEEDV
jgi:hypothetical protein